MAQNEDQKESTADIPFDLKISVDLVGTVVLQVRNVTKSWTTSRVKLRAMEERGYKVVHLLHGGRPMQDNRTLEDYGIVNGAHKPVFAVCGIIGGGSVDDEKRDINTRIKEEIQVIASKPDAPREKVYELAKKTYRREGKPVIIDTKNVLTDVKQNARNYRNVALPMTLAMDRDFSTWNEQQFKRDVANKFKVPFEIIKNVSARAGSIIAEFELHTHWIKDGKEQSMSIQVIADKVDPVIAKKAFAEFAVFAVEFKEPIPGFDCLKQQVIMNPKWNRTYGPGATNWDGPLNDGKSRGGEPYYCPIGWKRFAIQFQETAYDFANVYDNWPIAYHGTKFDFSWMITLSGLKATSGDHGAGVYLSPCIEYSAHPRYAKPVQLDFSKYEALQKDHKAEFKKYDKKWIQCIFACRVKPRSYKPMAETMGMNGQQIKIHPDYSNDAIEWIVSEPRNGIVGPDRILIYGIMIRATDEYPLSLPTSHWWTKFEPYYWKDGQYRG